jgi:hypothetical protein
MKNLYEVFDEFEEAKTKETRMKVIEKNLSQHLVDALQYTYHPDFDWKIKDIPHNYKLPDAPPGMSYSNISKELKKFYMFRAGDPRCEKLTDKRREELLIQMMESLEPREIEVVIGIFKKDLGVKGLNYKFVKEAFPNLLP